MPSEFAPRHYEIGPDVPRDVVCGDETFRFFSIAPGSVVSPHRMELLRLLCYGIKDSATDSIIVHVRLRSVD